jgi:hypothetical protein
VGGWGDVVFIECYQKTMANDHNIDPHLSNKVG